MRITPDKRSKSFIKASVVGSGFSSNEWTRSPAISWWSRISADQPLLLVQYLMYRSDRDRPLAHGRCHPFQAPGADVAHREDPGATRLEQMGSAGERPPRGGQLLGRQVRSRLDEPVVVEREAAVQPAGARHRARHGEDVPDAVRLDASALVIAPAHALEVAVALEAHDLRAYMPDDGRMVLDAADQVARHRIGQTRRADHHVHSPGGLGQEHRRLARRVAGAHDDHLFTGA